MTKTRPWSELKAKIEADPVRRARVEEGKKAIEDGLALGRMRSELGMQEFDVPESLESARAQPGDGEVTEDVYVATLRSYIEAMGGAWKSTRSFRTARSRCSLAVRAGRSSLRRGVFGRRVRQPASRRRVRSSGKATSWLCPYCGSK